MNSTTHSKRAVFLDRDGTLNAETRFAHRVEDLRLLAGAVEGLRQMAALGFQLFITTNQSGIGRGYFSEAQMHAFHAALCQRLAAGGVTIAGIYFCPFHPTAGLGPYRLDSPLRKPRPGMILQAAAEHDLDLTVSYTIGDRASDILAGQAAGCRTILLRTRSVHGNQESDDTPALGPHADFEAADLVEAAQFIEQTARRPAGPLPMIRAPQGAAAGYRLPQGEQWP